MNSINSFLLNIPEFLDNHLNQIYLVGFSRLTHNFIVKNIYI